MPTKSEMKAAREEAGLTQLEAIRVLRPENQTPRTWSTWEKDGSIPSELWEYFLLKTKNARKKNQTKENAK